VLDNNQQILKVVCDRMVAQDKRHEHNLDLVQVYASALADVQAEGGDGDDKSSVADKMMMQLAPHLLEKLTTSKPPGNGG